MTTASSIFSQLIVSSPNDGGLFVISNGAVHGIDDTSTTGISLSDGTFARAIQPNSLRIYTQQHTRDILLDSQLGDVHDVLSVADHYYIVGTKNNTVAKIMSDGAVSRRWSLDGEEDSHHLNCLALWQDRIVYSAFGDFRTSRGYKTGSLGTGLVRELLSGRKLVEGLSQPHSLTSTGENLIIANSEMEQIVEFDIFGRMIRSLTLGGYTRGICCARGLIFVGLSAPRQLPYPTDRTASIVALDAETWEIVGRISLPTQEIYSIAHVDDSDEFVGWVTNFSCDAVSRVADASTLLIASNAASHSSAVSVFENQKSALEAELAAVRQDMARLKQEVTAARGETSRILASTTWRITLPLRHLARLGKGIRRRTLDLAYDSYRALPLPRLVRQRLSGSLAKAMPGLHSTVIGHLHQKAVRTPLTEASLAMLQSGADRPAFTVVIPIYNRTWELREAIQSVLGQSVQNIELILVADGSPPETLAVIDEFRGDPRVRIFSFPRSSGTAVRGRNKGILDARAPYIAFLDSDDICEPDRLEQSFEMLEDGNDVVYGAWRAKLDGSRDTQGLADGQVVVSPQCDLQMLRQVCIPCQSTVAARRSRLMEVGLLKPQMRYREDHELWVRLALNGAKFKATNAVLATLRLHQGNNELNFKKDDAQWAVLLERECSIVPPRPQKIAFVVAGLGISGGLAIVLKHAEALIAAGHDVTLLDCSNSRSDGQDWARSGNVPVIAWQDIGPFLHTPFDAVYATFWTTVDAVKALPAVRRLYFVQSDERLFYTDAGTKELVERTYREPMEYVAVADWIAKFLQDEFGHIAHVVHNGVDLRDFNQVLGLRGGGQRPRVLIEGPISVPFKGVADAYAATEGLDCDVWLVSSAGQPEPRWKLAKFVSGASIEQMAELYSACDVLVKLSRIESFCLPALEAMACGCAVVVGEVTGGMEFVENGRNAVVVQSGDITAARQAVAELLANSQRRAELVSAGHKTAAKWSFDQSAAAMLALVQRSAASSSNSPPPGR